MPYHHVVDGHAIAGSFFVASDFQLSERRSEIGLSEVDLGVAVPADARALLEAEHPLQMRCGSAQQGELITPQRALEIKHATTLAGDPTPNR